MQNIVVGRIVGAQRRSGDGRSQEHPGDGGGG
jgi:hypothetical protein